MTQEDKEQLLKDLCVRLPYGVVVKDRNGVHTLTTGNTEFTDLFNGKCNIAPYLFPLSSMTDEQKHELKMSTCPNGTGYFNEYSLCCSVNHFGEEIPFGFMSSIIDYLNKHHFDYRGLIEKSLALDATGLNIY